MDGYRLIYKVRRDSKLKDIPFIMYTAASLSTDEEEFAIRLGVNKYIRKVGNTREIINCISELLKQGNGILNTKDQRSNHDQWVMEKYNNLLVHKLDDKIDELEKTKKELSDALNKEKEARVQLDHLNRNLEKQFIEISRQKVQIESINKSLLELNEEKNDLISIVAHDLKSPLNQICGLLEIIKLTAKDQTGEQRTYTAQIEQSTRNLRNMVTKILDVSAIEAQTLNIKFESINITELLNEIVDRFIEMAAKKQIKILKEIDSKASFITSDRGYVSEVLQNLMSNAVKYSFLEKNITVRLFQQPASVRIEFVDEGEGISENDMKNLFGKFHKLSARPTAGEDSTGLGLSIVKKYVTALNGKVWCESEVGKGSNFIVELPLD